MKFSIAPIPKPRQTRSDVWKQRTCVMRYREFATRLRQLVPKDYINRLESQGMLRVTFTISMPKSWSKKKKQEMNGQPHKQRGDIDNYCKSVMDALLKEDSCIWSIIADKYWGEGGSIEFY